VFEAFHKNGYSIKPINPKYPDIDGQPCYPALASLPERPEVVIVALGPAVTEKVMPEVIASGAKVIWMPPGCFNDVTVKACQAAGVCELHDICPVSTLGMMCAKS
jgi:predicted CoA-binding protein